MGHQDFAHELQGSISLQFYWAPYPANLTAVLGQLAAAQGPAGTRRLLDAGAQPAEQQVGEQQAEEVPQAGVAAESGPERMAAEQGEEGREEEEEQQQQQGRKQPAVVALSATLWHLLHVTAADDFGAQLAPLGQAAAAYAASAAAGQGGGSSGGSSSGGSSGSGPRLVLASGTEMFPNRMKTAQKQHSMTPANLDAYNQAMQQVGGASHRRTARLGRRAKVGGAEAGLLRWQGKAAGRGWRRWPGTLHPWVVP